MDAVKTAMEHQKQTEPTEDVADEKLEDKQLQSDHIASQDKKDGDVDPSTALEEKRDPELGEDVALKENRGSPIDGDGVLEEKFAGLMGDTAQGATAMGLPTLPATCSVKKGLKRTVESLEAVWKKRCLKMGIMGPISGASWKHTFRKALEKLPELMESGKAFVTHRLTLPRENIPATQWINCLAYADGLLVAGDNLGFITVWFMCEGPWDHFCALPNENITAVSLCDGILAIGTSSGRLRIEYLDALGHRKPGGWDVDPMDGQLIGLNVVPALRLLVGSYINRTANNDEQGGSYVFWTSLDTGKQLAAEHCRSLWHTLFFAPATSTGTFHQIVVLDFGATVFKWPKYSPDGSPYGDVNAIQRGSEVEQEWSEVNIVMYSQLFEDRPYREDLPLFCTFRVIPQTYYYASPEYLIRGEYKNCVKQFRSYTVSDCADPEAPSKNTKIVALFCSSSLESVVLGEVPWLEKLSSWEAGQVVAAYVEDNKVYMVLTECLGDLLASPKEPKAAIIM